MDDGTARAAAPVGARVLGTLLVGASALTVLYWIEFFSSGMVQASADPCYLGFERAFPGADGWAAAAALVAGVALWRGRPSAVVFGIAAGSAYVFLGFMDVLYNLEHGMYALRTAEMANETLINVVCLTLGPAAMIFPWRWRRALDVDSRCARPS